MRSRVALSAVLLLVLFVTGCAMKRPVLYPNRTYREVGKVHAEEDVAACIALAKDADLQEGRASKVAKRTAVGGATGGAVGGAVGAVVGSAGTGAAAGAAGAGAGSFVRGIFRSREPDPLFIRYVDICLQERGYRILGWK